MRRAFHARLTNAADQGPQGLRQFVTRSRMIYQIDDRGAVACVDRYRRAQDACDAQLASDVAGISSSSFTEADRIPGVAPDDDR